MSDILLSVGLQKGTAEVSQIQTDLHSIISRLDRNPPKVKVGLQVDQAALNHFKSQLTKIVNSVGLSQGAPITVNISGLGEISAKADSARDAFNRMGDAARNAGAAAANAGASAASATANAEKETRKLELAERERQRLLQQSTTLLTQMQSAERNWTKSAHGATQSQYASIQSYISQLQTLRAQFEAGTISASTFNLSISRLRTGFGEMGSQIKNANEATKTLRDRFADLSAKFGSWLTVSQAVMAAVRTVKKMVTTVIELDTAMTELKKVTKENEVTYTRFLVKATDRARALGASLSDVVSATADFARLGYSVDAASKLADIALLYKNIGDGVENVTQATESIVSTMQAFGILPYQAEHIVDVFNSIGNKFAISSGGIGEALQRSAAAMNAAGNTLEETAALVAAANTVVQNPDAVGTTLKTVSMFLRAAKVEAEEAGESTEGMAHSVSELRNQLLALTDGRVDILTESGQYKSTYEILKAISYVWDDIVTNQGTDSAAILELIGGKRNANTVAAILENFEIAEKALGVALNSAGSAMEENEKHLDSIAGKIGRFNASWQTLSSTVINSNFVKTIVDVGTALLSVTNAIAKFTGGIGGVLAIIPAAIAAYSKFETVRKIFDGLRTTFTSLVGGAK